MDTFFSESIYCQPDPCIEYPCHNNVKSTGFSLLMKLVLLTRDYRETELYIKNYVKKNMKNTNEGINKQNDKGWTALMLAIANLNRYSTENTIKILLDAKANVNLKNISSSTALMLAANTGYDARNIIKILLDAGADPNMQDNYGSTALMHMITTNKLFAERSIDALLEAPVNVDLQDRAGNTALMLAVKNTGDNAEAVINMLLDCQANVNILNNNKDSVLKLYLTNTRLFNVQLMDKLLETYNFNTQDIYGDTLLTIAIKKNNDIDIDSVVKQLIDKTNLRLTNNHGNTILHIMLKVCKAKNKNELVDILLQIDSSYINVKNNIEDTPIMTCVKWNKGNTVLFNKLYDKGANINMVNSKGNSVIRYIIENDDIVLAKLYVEKGGSLNCNLFKYIKDPVLEDYLKPYIIKYEYYKIMHKNMINDIKKYMEKRISSDGHRLIKLSDSIKTNYLV